MTPVLLAERPSALLVPEPIEDTPPLDTTRREFITGVGAAALAAAFLAACGEDDATSQAASDARFPRTVRHALGETTIPTRPERVVTLEDRNDVEGILAVGVTPVLFGFKDQLGTGIPPWMEELGEVERFGGEVDLEQIAAARPDLIVGPAWAAEDVYEQLSAIAPTVALVVGGTWREHQLLIGEALGREQEAKDAIARAESALAAAKESLAAHSSMRVLHAYPWGDSIYIETDRSQWSQFLSEVGMPYAQPRDAAADAFEIAASIEQVNLLNETDILICSELNAEATALLEASRLFQGLDVVREGRYVRLSAVEARALAAPMPPGLEWAVPRLADAIVSAAQGDGRQLG